MAEVGVTFRNKEFSHITGEKLMNLKIKEKEG
jgi:hypothetical protein